MLIFYLWDEPTSQWALNNKATYYYSEHNITFIHTIPEKHLSVYPNPAKEFIVYDLTNISSSATVEMFDIQGKKVLDQKLPENKQIPVNTLNKGLYLYRLVDGGNIYVGKITVE
jgi:hypothetical protein